MILDLKRLARSRRVLLVADNAHWWDADSLRLLHDILAGQLRESLPRIESITALVVDTAAEQPPVAGAEFGLLVRLCSEHTERLSRCTPEEFADILRCFGLTARLPDDVVRALFTATNEHLKLAEQVAAYAEHSHVNDLIDATVVHRLVGFAPTR